MIVVERVQPETGVKVSNGQYPSFDGSDGVDRTVTISGTGTLRNRL